MSDRKNTFHTVQALLALQEEKDKVYNLRELQFSDENRNISVSLGYDDIGTTVKNVKREIANSKEKHFKPRVYMDLAKHAINRENFEIRNFKGVNWNQSTLTD